MTCPVEDRPGRSGTRRSQGRRLLDREPMTVLEEKSRPVIVREGREGIEDPASIGELESQLPGIGRGFVQPALYCAIQICIDGAGCLSTSQCLALVGCDNMEPIPDRRFAPEGVQSADRAHQNPGSVSLPAIGEERSQILKILPIVPRVQLYRVES